MVDYDLVRAVRNAPMGLYTITTIGVIINK